MKTIDFEVGVSEYMNDAEVYSPVELTIVGDQIICMSPETARVLIERLTKAAEYAEWWRAWRSGVSCN